MATPSGSGPLSSIMVRRAVRLCAVGVLVGGSLVVGVAPAAAATGVFLAPDRIQVTAGAGVANDIVIAVSGSDVVVTDRGDSVTPGSHCVAVTAASVRCPASGANEIVVDLRDGNDVVLVDTPIPTVLRGGAGDDVLIAGDGSYYMAHYGGAGDDTMRGGPSFDALIGGPGSDSMRGGGGLDTASYDSRAAAVRVDIDGIADDGAPGERDNVHPDVEGVSGGRGDDVLTGSGAADHLHGGAGDDRLIGLGGDDTFDGARGTDAVSGGAGDDTSYYGDDARSDGAGDVFGGGSGADTAWYGGRSEALQVSLDGVADDGAVGERDNNRADVENVRAGFGRDVLVGNASSNHLRGGFGSDTIRGLGGDDRLGGDSGNDSLSGGDGDDLIDGAVGADRLYGVGGDDLLLGGPGPQPDPERRMGDADRLSGGAGVDTVSYCCRVEGVTADADGVADDGWPEERDQVGVTVENIEGGPAADRLTGNDGANSLTGNGGDDVLTGLGGEDTLDGGTGRDDLRGGSGDDRLSSVDGVSGNDAMSGGPDTDACTGDADDSRTDCEG